MTDLAKVKKVAVRGCSRTANFFWWLAGSIILYLKGKNDDHQLSFFKLGSPSGADGKLASRQGVLGWAKLAKTTPARLPCRQLGGRG